MLFIFGSSSRVDIVIKRLTGKNNSCCAESFKQKKEHVWENQILNQQCKHLDLSLSV